MKRYLYAIVGEEANPVIPYQKDYYVEGVDMGGNRVGVCRHVSRDDAIAVGEGIAEYIRDMDALVVRPSPRKFIVSGETVDGRELSPFITESLDEAMKAVKDNLRLGHLPKLETVLF